MNRNGIVHLDCWSIRILSIFGAFVRFDFYPLGLLSYGAFVHWGFSLSTHVITWRECWLHTPVSCYQMSRNGIVHLDGWSIRIFSLLGLLSALIFILWGFCPMVLSSIGAFLCPPMWSHEENVDCPHMYHVITWTEMALYILIVGVLEYCQFLGLLSALIFILWGFCPLLLSSIGDFLCPPTWSHEENVDCPHLYHTHHEITRRKVNIWLHAFIIYKCDHITFYVSLVIVHFYWPITIMRNFALSICLCDV